jgi:hypothetical protein
MRIKEIITEAHDIQPLMIYSNGWVVQYRAHAFQRALERGMPPNVFLELLKQVTQIPNLEHEVAIRQEFWIRDRAINMNMAFRRIRPNIVDPDNVVPQLKRPDFKGVLMAGTVLTKVPMHTSNVTTYPVDLGMERVPNGS